MTELSITVIGSGLMGHGIAYVFASSGHRVAIYDPDKNVLASTVSRISEIFSMLEQAPEGLDNIKTFDSLEKSAEQADVIIEAAPEKLELKRELFDELIASSPVNSILATNTSGIPIGEIAKHTLAPDRIVGTHFWNPPYLIPLVEVIQSQYSNPEVVQRIMMILESVGKTPVLVRKDIAGFIGNRLQHALKREAIALVERGICDAETVDLVVKEGFGMRLAVMGPLENSDLVGLDLTLDIHESLLGDLDISVEPQKLLRQKVEKGELGMSVGEGFRRWTRGEAEAARARMDLHLLKAAKDRLSKP